MHTLPQPEHTTPPWSRSGSGRSRVGGALLAPGDPVSFTGHVEPFGRAAVSEALGSVLNEALFADHGGEPAVLVDRLDVTPASPVG